MTIRKAAAEDLQAIVSIYDEIHGREEAGEVTIGWIRDVYPVRKTAEDAISRGDMFVQEDETGAVTATGIINQVQVDVYEKGEWQMVFGLCTLPDYRQRGFAQTLLKEFIRTAKSEGRKGVVLTCKKELITYYEKFGFVSEGVTENSVIGGVQWYQMRRVL